MRETDGGSRIYHIAVMVAGTDEEYQSAILNGITEAARLLDLNVSVFASFGGVLDSKPNDIGEYNIYSLVNYEQLDGAILLTNTICDLQVRRKICEDVIRAGIPAVIFDSDEYPEFYNIRIDNNIAMRQMVEHVIVHHGARRINFISGPAENPEGAARYKTFLEVMEEHGLPVEEQRVYFGLFRPADGKAAVEELLASGIPLPDAIIAANDAMGLEAVDTLTAHGIRVPEDVIVTGFDWTYFAQHHNPALTSVSRPLLEAGKAAVRLLGRIVRGQESERTVTLSATPVYTESCGCVNTAVADSRHYRSLTYDIIQRFRSGTSMLTRMTAALSANETPDDSIRIISQYLHEVNCEQCCICLCENWEAAFRIGGSQQRTPDQIYGYTKTMSAPLVWDQGKIERVSRFASEQMYPIPLTTPGNTSYFYPLHFSEHCLGYYIFTNTEFSTRSMLCHLMMINISHSFENIRKLQNLDCAIRELDRMYVIDPLCDIYNRAGFLRRAEQLFQQCCKEQEDLMIAFIDMDGLKKINDNCGHEEGDFALRALAEVIRKTCTEDQVCARFGGDEFVVAGSGVSEQDAAAFETRFQEHLERRNAQLDKPYPLSASIGTYVTRVTEQMDLYSLINKADQLMYERKIRKHAARKRG